MHMIKPDQQSEIETSETSEMPVVALTPVAANKVRELLTQENDPNLGLRIFVAGGGCSGLQYGMTLDEEQEDDAITLIKHQDGDFKVLVDYVSKGLLDGCEVDYLDSLMGAGFTVNNPNAVSSCGCGQSFKTAEDTDSQPRSCGCGH
jgi:iron-sulfur cluster assembly accessory protein